MIIINKNKTIKDFKEYICNWIISNFKDEDHDHFMYKLHDEPLAFLIADKGFDKQIEKYLLKNFGARVKATFTIQDISPNRYPDAELRITLLDRRRRYYENQFQYL